LGYDILGRNDIGPADILLSKDVIVLGGKEIPCINRRRSQRARKVVVADDTVVPGLSEVVVGVNIERDEDDDEDPASSYVVEPRNDFGMRYKLMMASTVVDVNGEPTCQICVTNPFKEAVDLRQSAEIAVAERAYKVVTAVTEVKDEGDMSNTQVVRRVHAKSSSVDPGDTEELGKDWIDQLSAHLMELHAKSTESDHRKRRHEQDALDLHLDCLADTHEQVSER